jgi:hypothetical protein
MKKLLIITATALNICATLSAMEKQETKRPKGPGKSIVKLCKLGESHEQTPTKGSKLPKGPGTRFMNLRPLIGQAKL